ncbi:hypothetical protein [uncultured Jatrophihabitans sp.]|uniref:hypothetical protein n=1 Tax=uncultured Jatrophihabitans sp. TaxID=1610747 RepID=UPI0035CA32F8
MFNLTDTVTVLGKRTTSAEPDTGNPVLEDTAEMVNQPCAFAVLSAQDHLQQWGDGATPTDTDAVTASLRLPTWAPALDGSDTHTITVNGYAGTWRVLSMRPGAQWSTYLLQLT